jgi:hypothetical protein
MAAAADARGVAMQWCMATPSDVLNALSYPSVTNFRVTTDFYYGRAWDVGKGSLLTWALGVKPSKDTFWTTDQRDIAVALGGCPSPGGCPDDHTDAGAELHTLLATMTTGPVGFSDAAGRTNGTRLGAVALPDGTLVQPSRPATPIDASFGSAWGDDGYVLCAHSGPAAATEGEMKGEREGEREGGREEERAGKVGAETETVNKNKTTRKNALRPAPTAPAAPTTPLSLSPWGWYIVAHQRKTVYTVSADRDLYPTPADLSTPLLWRRWDGGASCTNGTVLRDACASSTVPAIQPSPAQAASDAEYYRPTLLVASPVCASSGWALLGDLSKFASLSATLFASVECTPVGLRITMADFGTGAAGSQSSAPTTSRTSRTSTTTRTARMSSFGTSSATNETSTAVRTTAAVNITVVTGAPRRVLVITAHSGESLDLGPPVEGRAGDPF